MTARRITLYLLPISIAALAWWLFGFSTETNFGLTMRLQRYFGRVVRADMDWNRDGKTDQSFRFTWREPMRHHQPPQLVLSDNDFDGRWDLWVVPGGKDAENFPLATFRVDTDGDGRPDWTFVDHWQSERSYEKIQSRRGF